MANLADFFAAESQASEHPKLRFWLGQQRRHAQSVARVEVRRVRRGLALLPIKVYFSLYVDGAEEVFQDEADWDDDLNQGLVDHGIRARDLQNEKVRFGLSLDSGFRRAEREFGDGYFNAVLIHFVKHTPLGEAPDVAQLLKEVREGQPSMEGKSYRLCVEFLKSTLQKRWEELLKLGYSGEQPAEVLSGALAQYLDDRFNITNRRILFGR